LRPDQAHAAFHIGAGDLCLQSFLQRAFPNDLTVKSAASGSQKRAGVDQVGEPLFLDQPSNGNDRRNTAAGVGRMKAG
jgi:hypothetical protein